jgi:predicted alpha/beta-fold hydrolase
MVAITQASIMSPLESPGFQAHPWLRGGHVQTLAGFLWQGRRSRPPVGVEQLHEVMLSDGDRLLVVESRPEGWTAGQPVAVLVHGLGGSANATYLVRLARRLHGRGVRVVRMNLRGAGDGLRLASRFYHAGRSDDVRAVADWLGPDSPIGLVGFSLGGNLVLRLAAEATTERPVAGLDCVVAACPPVDLAACCRFLSRPAGRGYGRNIVATLCRQVARLEALHPALPRTDLRGVRTVEAFDARYTAPTNGFADADDYYTRSSSGPRLGAIGVPGLIVHADDDPFIPPSIFHGLSLPAAVRLESWPSGGHLGFVSHQPWGGDRRWLDARIESWLLQRWESPIPGEGHPG